MDNGNDPPAYHFCDENMIPRQQIVALAVHVSAFKYTCFPPKGVN